MPWNKVKFFYDTMLGSTGSTLAVTSTATGYDVANIYSTLETNLWKAANTTSPHYISYDAGAGNTKSADYLAVLGHNLFTAGATVALQYSSDNVTYADAFTAFAVAADTVVLKEFASPGAYRYWRLKLTGQTVAPFITICIWGLKTEIDYASSSFDPHGQEVKASVNLSQSGYVAGIHTHYTEREMTLRFEDADDTLYQKVKTWWEASGLKNFFVAWENSAHADDVFLMRPDTKFNNPLKLGGAYRDITVSLKGRKA